MSLVRLRRDALNPRPVVYSDTIAVQRSRRAIRLALRVVNMRVRGGLLRPQAPRSSGAGSDDALLTRACRHGQP
jgi:hypothetical protein